MKQRIYKILSVLLLTMVLVNCTDRFAAINKDPGEVTDPDITYLFTNALNGLGDGYLDWFYNNSVYYWRYSQMTVARGGTNSDFNNVGALGGVSPYGMLIDMKEIRNRIEKMPAEQKAVYQAFNAVTYIPVIDIAMRASDWEGSMVYSEAVDARYGGNMKPKFDTQQELYDIWIKELDAAIAALTTADSKQVQIGNQDYMFKSDWESWARYANCLKLRIAARLEKADNAKMRTLLTSIVNQKDKSGQTLLITQLSQQAVWAPGATEAGPGGGNSLWIENYAPSNKYSKFMRTANDPRLRICFRTNSLNDAAITALQATPGITVPKFATKPVNEPWDRLVGAPVAPDSAGIKDYFGATLIDATGATYQRLPFVEYNYIKPKQNGRNGEYLCYVVGAPEMCLYLAEFTEKGYVSGIGTAKEWYEKGVNLSLQNYNNRAAKAQIPDFNTRGLVTGEVESLLAKDNVKYITGDPKNIEKIILQELVNLFDNPYQCVSVTRRTGFPKKGSTIWPWEPYTVSGTELKLPRRFPVNTPTIDNNKANWQTAITAQGFTPDNNTGEILNAERVWWDKTAPDYGGGQ